MIRQCSTQLWCETAGGGLCRNSSQLSALGWFQHYGVAPPPYHSGWASHPHLNWTGQMDTQEPLLPLTVYPSGDRTPADSRDLILAATRRFVSRVKDRRPMSPIVVVFSSQSWDISRHHEQFARQNPRDWAEQYRRNFTKLVKQLVSEIPSPMRLILVADYPTIGAARHHHKSLVNQTEEMEEQAALASRH